MVPAIVLAAGRSTRMGRAKALLMLDRETFLSRVVRTLRDAHVDDVVVVLGHEPDAIVADCERRALNVRFAINRDYDAGRLTSLLTGLRVIDRPGVAAALVTLVDVPLVTASTVRAVLERYRRTPPIDRWMARSGASQARRSPRRSTRMPGSTTRLLLRPAQTGRG